MPRKRRPSELLAPGEYERLCGRYGEVCWICATPPKTRRLHVDHDHRTGEVRGLLCFRCNRFLHSWMTRAWLEAAADYIDPGPTPEELRAQHEARLASGRWEMKTQKIRTDWPPL